MGNQQQNMNFEIGYLLGMLDGEGSISIIRGAKTNTPPIYAKLIPQITICNTNQDIIDRCIEYMKKLELPFFISVSYRALKYKPVIRVTISGLGRCSKWIGCFKEYNFGKKDRLEIIEKFIFSRLNSISDHPSQKPYSNGEISLFNQIRMLNGMGGKSRSLFVLNSLTSTVKEKRYKFEKMVELLDKGWNQNRIADFFGIDQSSVNKWIKRNKKFMDAQRLPSGLLK